jgi:hypothetical protein
MAQIPRKALPDDNAEHPSKYVVQQDSDTPVEMPIVATPKRKSSDEDDAETIDLRELGTTPRIMCPLLRSISNSLHEEQLYSEYMKYKCRITPT